jgi:hypothetical protein
MTWFLFLVEPPFAVASDERPGTRNQEPKTRNWFLCSVLNVEDA